MNARYVPLQTGDLIPLSAGLCAGTESGVPRGRPIQEFTGGNLFPDRGEYEKKLVTISHPQSLRLRGCYPYQPVEKKVGLKNQSQFDTSLEGVQQKSEV